MIHLRGLLQNTGKGFRVSISQYFATAPLETSGGSHGFPGEIAASQRKSGMGNALISVSLIHHRSPQSQKRHNARLPLFLYNIDCIIAVGTFDRSSKSLICIYA